MLISVIIPFYNAAATLPGCLAALAAMRYNDAEYILVDNDSTDDSVGIANRFIQANPALDARVVREERRGWQTARNRGAMEARGEWLAFTDADCIPDPDWLNDLAREMDKDATVGALAGQILPGKISNAVSKCLSMFTLPANPEEQIFRAFTLVSGGFPTANFAVRQMVFDQLGGFDETAEPAGDYDLCARIYAAGFAIKALTNARVKHQHRTKLKNFIEQARRFGETHAILLKRYKPGVCLIDMPFVGSVRLETSFCRVWLEFNQADKKLMGTIIAGLIWPPLFLLSLAYLTYLSLSIYRRGALIRIPVKIVEAPVLAGLLLLKSAAMTCGRLYGSLRYKVICI
jgi:GT2 family glycosyltransferase